ncbi:MAG: 30S ribosomal protein S12 methylthiotransferase RimO [Clostridia bacterium]|nr:30S ribosomal protein S12 methylthiotransferase RimO [Clostridia bacterium]
MTDFSVKKFALISLGCDKNRVDSEKLLSVIRSEGCTVIDSLDDADVIIVNTCAFLGASRKESIDTILECAEYKKRGAEKLVVTGCLPQKYISELYPELHEVDVFLGTYDYELFFDALEKSYLGERVSLVGNGCDGLGSERCLTTPGHYAYLKIADGCSNFCTYCIIPRIRGKYKSYPIKSLVEEAEGLGDVKELILVAQDVTRYGCDLTRDGSPKLVELLRELSALDSIGSIRLLYCYPEMVDASLISEIRDNPKIIKYIDIPLQHSETRLLKLMNRKGSREMYSGLIKKLRAEVPGIAVRSTFITGFPSETEEEVDALCSFLRENALTNCGFFAYSREEGTPAYGMSGQIRYGTKKQRVKKLYSVQQEISKEFLSGFVGKKLKVLCDGIDFARECFVGRAYFSAPDIDGNVYFKSPLAVQGEYYDVVIERSSEYDLYGRTEDYE